ncbi:MAG: metal-dependent transcriptional regulator [Lachnospiraceae bacterium]|nr:metal-dependent transcriptional regulator [Lachnospiraceae bacterium]
MKMQESAQDYLESILILSQSKELVRATDICHYFGYARPTVSVFLKQLKENGYVEIDSQKNITLTESGAEIANDMYERHLFLTKFFTDIGVPEDIAAKDACRVEHYVSKETFAAMKDHFS